VKKSKIFFEIVFRCDAGEIPELGYGHLFRSIVIANELKKKFKINSKKIAFLIKVKKDFSKSYKILKKYNFKILPVDSNVKDYSKNEAEYFKNIRANLLILDRLGKIKKDFFYQVSDNFKKKIIIDDSSKNRELFDLSLNPLIQNVAKVKNSNVGYNYMILNPQCHLKNKYKLNNIFLFFGGHDHKNISNRIIKLLNQIKKKFKVFVPILYKKKFKNIYSFHKIEYYSSVKFYEKLRSSNIAITSGGLSLFDSILYKKKIICIPQYKHQHINAKKLSKLCAINLLNLDNNNFEINFLKLFNKVYYSKKHQKKLNNIHDSIINFTMLKDTFKKIFKLYNATL